MFTEEFSRIITLILFTEKRRVGSRYSGHLDTTIEKYYWFENREDAKGKYLIVYPKKIANKFQLGNRKRNYR